MSLPTSKNPDREIPGVPWLLWDIVRAARGRPEDTVSRQQARLRRLIEYARSRSPYYRERYAALPRGARDLPALPPVTKSDLMANFNGWATDPAVTREGSEAFIRDSTRIGDYYLDRYVAFSSSGTTGTPALTAKAFAAALSPQRLMTEAGGPMKVMLQSLQTSAKCAFSARNP